GGAPPFGVGGRHVRAVGGHAVAENFGQNLRPAGPRVLVLFEDDDAGPFGQDEAVAVAIEGSRGSLGIVVAGGEGLHAGKARQAHGSGGGLAAAGDHDIRHVVLDDAEGVADRVGGRGTGGGNGAVGSLEPPVDGDVAAG